MVKRILLTFSLLVIMTTSLWSQEHEEPVTYLRRGSSITIDGGFGTWEPPVPLVELQYRYTFNPKGRLLVSAGTFFNEFSVDSAPFLMEIAYQFLFSLKRAPQHTFFITTGVGGMTDHIGQSFPLPGLVVGGGYEFHMTEKLALGAWLHLPFYAGFHLIPLPQLKAGLTYKF